MLFRVMCFRGAFEPRFAADGFVRLALAGVFVVAISSGSLLARWTGADRFLLPGHRRWPKSIDRAAVRSAFGDYQITLGTLSRLRADAIFLPCPPVTRGEEVSEDAMTSHLVANHAAKTHLLHVQNALLEDAILQNLGAVH